jgi:DNA-binding transcriptional regulator YdaS (Cro superfamily)
MRHHPIRAYCLRHGMSQSDFARLVGISKQYVCDMIAGRSLCGPETAFKIEDATQGEIPAIEILRWGRKVAA